MFGQALRSAWTVKRSPMNVGKSARNVAKRVSATGLATAGSSDFRRAGRAVELFEVDGLGEARDLALGKLRAAREESPNTGFTEERYQLSVELVVDALSGDVSLSAAGAQALGVHKALDPLSLCRVHPKHPSCHLA
jgi:hypothetical protein